MAKTSSDPSNPFDWIPMYLAKVTLITLCNKLGILSSSLYDEVTEQLIHK